MDELKPGSLLGKNKGASLCGHGLGNGVLDMTSKDSNKRINKLDYIKIKNSVPETIVSKI